MSTPSTATVTGHPPHLHYGFPHRQNYAPTTAALPSDSHRHRHPPTGTSASTSTSTTTRQPASPYLPRTTATLKPTPTTRPPPTLTTRPGPAPPSASASAASTARRARTPDWGEFYKNGLPKEVIVIDDDDEEGEGEGEGDVPPAPRTTRTRPAPNARHADKKRKTGPNAHAHAPSTDHSPASTAPTSLTSDHSHDVERAGQKRKRTRKAAADEAKQRPWEIRGDAFRDYHPPPRPPIKATDVPVPVIPEPARSSPCDDEDGHYLVHHDTELTDRYQVRRLLGQGTFGKVVEAYDRRKRTRCAIKVIRSVPKYRDASRIELRVLSTLASNDRENRNRCIHLRDCFDYRNHICIVTDLLGQSVFDFLKANQFVPFPSSQIQSFARQLLTSVAFLHDLNLIHTDLKPENILLVAGAYQMFTYNRPIPASSATAARHARHRRVLLDPDIRLIDFGSATFDDEYHSSVVSTRHYRAPEIILGLGWSFPCDIWSIGCILVEFFTGDALFQTHDNLEHLAMMESVCGGKIEPRLVRQVIQAGRGSNAAAKFFVRGNRLDYPNAETSKASKKYVKAMRKLHDFIPANSAFNRQFLDLLRSIFLYDPKQRITAKEALKHQWFKESIVDDGSEAARILHERTR